MFRVLPWLLYLVMAGSAAKAQPAETPVVEPPAFCRGIDVSKYQFEIDWNCVDTTLHFVIVKATEGLTLTDRKFEYNWNNIHPRYKRGAYHFFRPNKSGKEQADFFLRTVKFNCGDMLPVIDIEYTRSYRNTPPKVYMANLRAMIREIENRLGVKPIIYTNNGFWNRYMARYAKELNDEYYLWIADYRKTENPKVPKNWNDWAIWQHSARGIVEGINSEVDLNVCKIPLDLMVIK